MKKSEEANAKSVPADHPDKTDERNTRKALGY
jgi:hypothetical protein